MRIAIPTHKRAILINSLTLGYLKRAGIKEEDVDLFVSGVDQADQYSSICNCSIIVSFATNVRDKFNDIHSYYPAGEEVLVLEDDLKSVKQLMGYNLLQECTDLGKHVALAFDLCRKHNTALWGINSNSNPFFMKEEPSVGFKFVVANMYGFIAQEDPILITQPSKTDYERTILYYLKYSNIVRMDYLCPVTTNYTTPGGMQEISQERAAMEEQSVEYLTTTYPQLCQRNTKKNSLYPEMTLRAKKKAATREPRLFGQADL